MLRRLRVAEILTAPRKLHEVCTTRAVAIFWQSRRMAHGSRIRGSKKARRQTTQATSIFTTNRATIRASYFSAGRRVVSASTRARFAAHTATPGQDSR